MSKYEEKFMHLAVKEAIEGVKKQDGGPFGAVIVKNSEIIAQGHNEVIKTNDPTMHAEVVAIRKASKKLGRFDLSDCEIYSSCEPCPMCLGAIHWAKFKKMYFGASRNDAARIGFDDEFIYDVILGKDVVEQVKTIQKDREICLEPMMLWEKIEKKTKY